MTEEIKELFKNLSPREHDVVMFMFGFYGRCRPAEEIATQYGVSKELILQIVQEALSKLELSPEELLAIGKKAAAEERDKAPKRPKRVISDEDNELLKIDFFNPPSSES